MPSLPDNGMVHLSSPYSVAETITRLEALLQAQGLTEFCRIDHSGEAEKAGPEDAAHASDHLRQPQGRDAADDRLPHARH